MSELIPAFDFHRVFIAPWSDGGSSFIWIALMGFFVAASCGLIGNYLILRRMALVGDAISHSILPGIAIAFLLANSRSTPVMFVGALAAGILTTVIIEIIHKKSRVKQDAAIGIAFSTLFAIGVILISLYADKVDLDQECVLYGEIAFVPLAPLVQIAGLSLAPEPVLRMGLVTVVTALVDAAVPAPCTEIASFWPVWCSSSIAYQRNGWMPLTTACGVPETWRPTNTRNAFAIPSCTSEN